jgi:hypothetical protein
MPRKRRFRPPISNLDTLARLASRLAPLLARNEGPDGTCWRYIGKKHRSGVGRVRLGGRDVTIARATHFLLHGRLPVGTLFRICETPGCVAPSHQSFERPAARPLRPQTSPAVVRAIRRLYDGGTRPEALAKFFGLSFSATLRVCKRQTHKLVPDLPPVAHDNLDDYDHAAATNGRASAHTGAA